MRYLPLTPEEEQKILKTCGEISFESLTRDIPENLRIKGPLKVPDALAESELLEHIQQLGEKNTAAKMHCLIGQGAYDHTWPAVIDYLVGRGEFLTAYTPYQPEVSQGTLQAIFEFQSMIAHLFGMEVSNASLYDGSTSLVEAALMAARLQNKGSGQILISEGTFDQTQNILRTYLEVLGFELVTWKANAEGVCTNALPALKNPVAVILQSPNKWGLVEDWHLATQVAQKLGVKSVGHVPHAHALAIFDAPGTAGIDIASGEGQSLGIPVGYGGPYVGLFACNKKDVRQMPGRLVGQTNDARGRQAFCVTLSTREQHIRREKATSNICSNQSLMALRSAIYLSLMGPQGLKEVAEISRNAAYHAKKLIQKHIGKTAGLKIPDGPIFNEFSLFYSQENERKIDRLQSLAQTQGILLGKKIQAPQESGAGGALTLAFTERFRKKEAEKLDKIFGELFV